MVAGRRFKILFRDLPGYFTHNFFCIAQLHGAARSFNQRAVLQIMKDEPLGFELPGALCGQGIDRELQAGVGIFLSSRVSGLVVSDDDAGERA